jgi:hypothetical protein
LGSYTQQQLDQWAGQVRYHCSAKHKDTPPPGQKPVNEPNATRCPDDLQCQDANTPGQLTQWLQTAFRNGYVSNRPRPDSGLPIQVWYYDAANDRNFEAKLGTWHEGYYYYHGYPLAREAMPTDFLRKTQKKEK